MPQLTRATLPQEFYDITSSRLLIQPEPQYLHARLFQMAMNAGLERLNILGSIPSRQFGDKGAQYTQEVSSLVLADGLYDAAMEVVTEIGGEFLPGHTIRLNRPAFVNSTYTEAVREITAGTTISTSPLAIGSEQVPVTVKRFGGPYGLGDDGVTGVHPYGIDKFDASFAIHRPAQIASLHLERDYKRTIDFMVRSLYDNAASIVRPVGMTTDNTAAVAGDFPFSAALLNATERTLDDLNIPVFANGRRLAVLHPRQCEQLSADPAFQRLAVFEKDFNPIFKGTYFRSFGQWDIMKSTTLNSALNTPAGVRIYHGQAFGPGAVGAGVKGMPGIYDNIQDNYGQTAYVIWLLNAGWATLNSSMIASIRTS
jgi:hypothetical protein